MLEFDGKLHLENPLSLIGSLFSVGVFSVLALAELVADKLPQTPNRTDAIGLVARILTGAFTGACVASSAGGAVLLGGILGAAGGVAGAFGGYAARKRLVQAFKTKGVFIALLEDVIAIAGSIWILSR